MGIAKPSGLAVGIQADMQHRTRFGSAVSAVLLIATASAQAPFGPWKGTVGLPVPHIVYVDPNGNDMFPGTKAAPFRTIGKALAVAAVANAQNPPLNATINLRAGTHAQTGTLRLPAHGVALEAYEPGVTVSRTTNGDVLTVDSPGNTALQPTLIQGLEILGRRAGAGSGVFFNPPIGPTATSRVELRDCRIRGSFFGVNILAVSGWTSENVIEGCEIFESTVGVQIVTSAGSVESTLIRGNDIHATDRNVFCSNFGASATRIVSNFIWGSAAQVDITGGWPFIVNNTIADGSTAISPFFGISYAGLGGEICTIANNILWNPPPSPTAPNPPEIVFSGTIPVVFHNDLEDGVFIGINSNIRVPPVFVPAAGDYHLVPASNPMLIDTGGNAWVAPSLQVPLPNNAGFVSSAAAVDGDADPRTIDFANTGAAVVDRGADEVTETRLAGTANIDPFGNMIVNQPNGDTTGTLTVTGRPNDAVGLYLAFQWPSDPVYQNLFFDPLGNYMMSVNPADYVFVGAGVLSPTGSLSLPVLVPALVPPHELECYVQGWTLRPNGTPGDTTNRLRLEVNS